MTDNLSGFNLSGFGSMTFTGHKSNRAKQTVHMSFQLTLDDVDNIDIIKKGIQRLQFVNKHSLTTKLVDDRLTTLSFVISVQGVASNEVNRFIAEAATGVLAAVEQLGTRKLAPASR